MKKPNINDVAKLAEVSQGTVSRSLNNDKRISKKTKERVLEAAKKLDYRPSLVPNILRSRETSTTGLVIANITNPFFPTIIKAVEDVALENKYMTVVCNSDENLQKEIEYFQMLEDRWIDGIIIAGIRGTDKEEKSCIQKLEKKGIPVVLMDREIEGYFANIVMIDNRGAAFRATRYLIDLEHRRIGFIGAPPNTKIMKDRLRGYREAIEESKIDFDKSLVIVGDQTAKSGEQAAKRFLSLSSAPTAIFACGDRMAIGAMREIQKKGLKVPENISIIGFDDIPSASFVRPSLTTIAQPVYQMGKKAMELLLENIRKEGLPKSKITLDTKLVIRESTAPIKKDSIFSNRSAFKVEDKVKIRKGRNENELSSPTN